MANHPHTRTCIQNIWPDFNTQIQTGDDTTKQISYLFHELPLFVRDCWRFPCLGQILVCLALSQLRQDDRVWKVAIRSNGVRRVKGRKWREEPVPLSSLVWSLCRWTCTNYTINVHDCIYSACIASNSDADEAYSIFWTESQMPSHAYIFSLYNVHLCTQLTKLLHPPKLWLREVDVYVHHSVSPGLAFCIFLTTSAILGFKVWSKMKKWTHWTVYVAIYTDG